MAYVSTKAASAGFFHAPVAALVAALTGWNDARITRKSLSALSARELDDIGLCYGDIEEIARSGRTR